MALQIGTLAPDFTLFSDEKKPVTLSHFRGHNVILNFFPAAFTGVCTAQLCDARDNMATYNSVGAVVLGISTDTVFALAKFKELNNYQFALLSDYDKKVIEAYDMVIPKFALGMTNIAKRSVFLIDREGVLKYSEVTASPADMPNLLKLRETLAEME